MELLCRVLGEPPEWVPTLSRRLGGPRVDARRSLAAALGPNETPAFPASGVPAPSAVLQQRRSAQRDLVRSRSSLVQHVRGGTPASR